MQNILFISSTVPESYPTIDKHYTWYPIHTTINFEEFSEIWQKKKPYAIYTYGTTTAWNYLSRVFNIRKRWIHLTELPQEIDVTTNIFSSVLGHSLDSEYPLISVITSTFHSKEKILRPWKSLRSQTYTNWEWIVWDDSEDNNTYGDLLRMKNKDLRMRVYKAPEHSGSIGEMKRLAAGVAYGSFILELDHDDELDSNLFQWIIDASKKYKEANFFYCNSAELYEGTLKSHSYGDNFAYGYGANLNVWSDQYKMWVTEMITAPPNPVTVRHLVGLPNHVRVWKTEFYDTIGKHNPRLSVSDDYELLVKSFIHGKWCHIRKCGYFQYRNTDGNFTFIRNSLIQHNVKQIYNYYKNQLPEIPRNYVSKEFWKGGYEFPKVHLTYDPASHTYSILMLDATKEKIDKILSSGYSVHIYIVGPCPDIPIEWRKYVSWWKLGTEHIDDKIRYIKSIATGSQIVKDTEFNPELPKLSIITPCCRPQNLIRLKESIDFKKIDKWYIVYDTTKNRTYTKQFNDSQIIELECGLPGISGNSMRNYGIQQVKDGLIYFLDDDNIIHPNLWTLLEKMDTSHFYTVDQINTSKFGTNGILKGNTIQVRKIDTAQFIVPREFMKDIEFHVNSYCADGEFIVEIYSKFSNCHIYIPQIASYYNYLVENR
jgi:glycosyltransferase involved in cell wall biosynthesis